MCSCWFHPQIFASPELTPGMNTLKKATFNEVFFDTVLHNYHEQNMTTAHMQCKYIPH